MTESGDEGMFPSAPHIINRFTPMSNADVLVVGSDSIRAFNNEPLRRHVEESAFAEPSPAATSQQQTSSKLFVQSSMPPHKTVTNSGEGSLNCHNPFHGSLNGKPSSTPQASSSTSSSPSDKHASKTSKLQLPHEADVAKPSKSTRKIKSICSQS